MLLLSVIITSIILAISFGVYELSVKEVILASFLKDSAQAFGAADRGIECALYWDRSTPQNGMPYTIFTTSTAYVSPPNLIPNAVCDNIQLGQAAQTLWTATNATPTSGMTEFRLIFSDKTCAELSILKSGNSTTTVVSNGYNTCDTSNPRRTQRTIEVTGNF